MKEENKRLIAIVNFKDCYFNYGDDYEQVAQSISEWSEVTEEEFELLTTFSGKYTWKVIERLDKKPKFIPTTVKAAINEARAHQELVAKQKAEAEAKKLARELKRKAKTIEQEKKLLDELKLKYEGK